MASEPPVITETRSLSIRQVSNGYVIQGSVMTVTVQPPATQGFTSNSNSEMIASTPTEVVDVVTSFLAGGGLEDPTP